MHPKTYEETYVKGLLTQPDYNNAQFLVLMITQLIMIVILVGLVIAWHFGNTNRLNPAEEIEEQFLEEVKQEMGVLPE
jgi:hypothetical protein